MATLAEKLIETIDKDIELLEKTEVVDQKIIRKECNIIKKRITDLEKLSPGEKGRLDNFKDRIEQILR